MRHPLGHEIEVEELTLLVVPKIVRDPFLAIFRPRVPSFCVLTMAEPAADLLQILFILVQQAVQADWSVVMRGRSERSEPEADVESGFPHRAVALVVVLAELE